MCFISLHTWHRSCRDLNLDISDVEVEGVNGDVLRNYGSAVEIKARDIKGRQAVSLQSGRTVFRQGDMKL